MLFLLVCLCIGAIAVMIVHFDRIAVAVIRSMHLPVCQTAVGIAILIVEHPEQWSCDQHRLSHRDIGSIWIANAAYGLHVDTAMGKWTPNFIERRIIREAVDWRIGRFIRDRVMVAVQRNMLAK
jgi:hypothetical protein